MDKKNLFEENSFIELKKNFCDEVIESLVAFSNFKGGKVIIGIDEKKKEIIGVTLEKETLSNWQNEIKNKTEPFITPEIKLEKIEGKKIIIFEIIEFPFKPVSFKGRYFLRKNNSNHKMSVSEVADMFLRTKRSSWDFYIREGVFKHDLDEIKIRLVMQMIEENLGVDLEDINYFLNKYSLVNVEDKVTNAAYLLFSKKSLRETDIQIGLFQDEITIKKDKVIRNDLISEVNEVMDFIKAYILKEFIITGKPRREERWQYPLDAIREIVINAIIHRDYRGVHSQFKVFNNKLDFYNHGSLPYDLSIEDILDGNKRSEPRNILIAEIFRDCGLIERYGSGVKRAREEFEKYGLPEMKIGNIGNGFEVIVYSKDYVDKKTTEKTTEKMTEKTTEKILKLIKEDSSITIFELSEKIGITKRNIEKNIVKLRKNGVIKRIGSDREGHWEILKSEIFFE